MKMKSDLDAHKEHMAVDEMNRDILDNLIGKQSFTLQDIDFTDVGDVGGLMDIFIEFEKDGILFYELLRTFIKERKVVQNLDRVIAEEYQHIETLQEMKLADH
jgi:hypothetical protein